MSHRENWQNVERWMVCRFCLDSRTDRLTSFFTPVSTNKRISTVNTTIIDILDLLQIKVSRHDKLPNWICKICIKLLYAVQLFITQAADSELIWKQMLKIYELPEVNDHRQSTDSEGDSESVIYSSKDNTTYDLRTAGEWVDNSQTEAIENINLALSNKTKSNQGPLYADYEHEPEIEWLAEEEEDEFARDAEQMAENASKVSIIEENILFSNCTEPRMDTISIDEAEILPLIPNQRSKPTGLNLCPICGIRCNSLAVHMRSHTNQRPYRCDQYRYSKGLKIRKQRFHNNNTRNFPCDVCGKSFALLKTLRAHQLSHAERKYHCTMCEKSFIFRWALAKHERTHTQEKPFDCLYEGCEKSFRSSSNLRQHELTHLEPKDRAVACDICRTVVRNKYALRVHKKQQHTTIENVA